MASDPAVPLIVLLHASPLEHALQHAGGGAVDEIPDVERHSERLDAFKALVECEKQVRLKSLPLTVRSLRDALAEARVILIGAHGLATGGLMVESDEQIGRAELLTEVALRQMLEEHKSRDASLPRMIFVSACHSEQFGITFEQLGVDHVVAIKGNDRVSNFVSRFFFHSFLKLTLQGSSVRAAFSETMEAIESHPELPAARRARQREKFVYLNRSSARETLFDREDLLPGPPEDLTELSSCFGFMKSDAPKPLFGRQALIRDLAGSIVSNRRVILHQAQSGLGSSAVVHSVCRYLADRHVFETIHLCESFRQAQRAILENCAGDGSSSSSPGPSSRLIVLDPVSWVKEPDEEEWFWSYFHTKGHSSSGNGYFIVTKRERRDLHPYLPFSLQPLEATHVEHFRTYMAHQLRLPASSLQMQCQGSPRQIISWARSIALQQSTHVEELNNARVGNADWESVLDRIFLDCVLGGDLWSRRERRSLLPNEVEWIRSIAIRYASIEEFWTKWLRPTLITLGFIEPFWTNHSVMGLISERDANLALQGREPGTFLLRCSESIPGQLTMSYVDPKSITIKKSMFSINSDGSVVMPRKEKEVVTRANLSEAVQSLRLLKRVVISRDGTETLDSAEAFADLL